MKLKNFVKQGFMAVCLFGNVLAAEAPFSYDKTLIIGCCPWDENIQDVEGIETAHFVDFLAQGAPEVVPASFNHLDINDTGIFEAGQFSDFAMANPGKFKTIIIDWATYHHIRRDSAWTDFAALLSPGGTLIIPVIRTHIMTNESKSVEAAREVMNKLPATFGAIDLWGLDTMPLGDHYEFLCRPAKIASIIETNPTIIFATKG